MATKDKKSGAKKATTKVTRITASDTTAPAKQTTSKTKKAEKHIQATSTKESTIQKASNPFVAIKRYFSGAWYELKQVRWPNRKATWGMTGAMLGFTAFFIIFILLLDALFKYLFGIILG